jgi:signal-transduction protein with cAMP-binding, CBS, and nucleotidyltransferase domain
MAKSGGTKTAPSASPAPAARRSQTAVFGKRVRDFMRPNVMTTPADAPVHQVIAEMAAAERSSVVLVDGSGRAVGILTERDVTRRVALSEVREGPVGSFATRPVHTVTADEYLYRAVARMRRLNLRHMPVVDGDGRPIGIVNLIDAVAVAAEQMLRQLDRLTRERTLEGMAEVKAAQVEIARELLADNLPAPDIQALITEINHDIHRQVLAGAARALVEAGWGEPPVPFTTLIMGSGGRGENFLFPDQDNGFILADYPDDEHGRMDRYFVALAERFNEDLDRVGFPLCKGHVMARNPVWRKTASQWRDQIELWGRRRSPVAILFADIFFDFQPIAGPREPGDELRRHVTAMLQAYPVLLSMMAQDETNKSVALGFFGRLLTDSSGQSPGRTDLKIRGTMPLVASVRLWALKHGVAQTGTLQRLAALAAQGALNRDDLDELTIAFHRVTFVLLRQQLDDFEAGRKVGNFVDTALLSRRERDELRHALRSIERFRAETRAAFTGAVF